MTLGNLSIIIPLGPEEDQLAPLLDDLRLLPSRDVEIILAPCADGFQALAKDGIRVVTAEQGRARQQNAGARAAKYDNLWFLHADSRIDPAVLDALEKALGDAPGALHYFHLKFDRDGPRGMWLNEWGGRFRSQILGLPFGDQGFCLRRDIFERLGGFPEQAPYGEDHLLVWHARRAGVAIRCAGAALTTSARKYQTYGWRRVTMTYQFLWIRQAWPEFWKFIRGG